MAHYGQLLDTFEPHKQIIYNAFDDYFNHPIMSKIKDVNGHSMYMSKTACLLSNECRYIICFVVLDDLPVGKTEALINIRWVSFQTRSLSERHNIQTHGYQPKRDGPLNVIIIRTDVTAEASTYKCDSFPLTVTLLHKKGENDYQPRGNVIAALETYSTIITLQ